MIHAPLPSVAAICWRPVTSLLLHLRASSDELPLGEVARLVAGAARLAGFDDLAQAAAAVADGTD
jgi:hypothetical protein